MSTSSLLLVHGLMQFKLHPLVCACENACAKWRFPVQIHVDNDQWRICALEMTYASAAAESTGGTGTQLEY